MKKLIILALLGLTLSCGNSNHEVKEPNNEPYNIVTLYDGGEVIAHWSFQGYVNTSYHDTEYMFHYEGNRVRIKGTVVIITSDKKFEEYPDNSMN